MAIEKQETNESQIGLTLFSKQRYIKTDVGSPPATDAIINDKEEEVTLESKKKKPRLGSCWDGVEPFEQSNMFKGLPEAKEQDNSVASRADSCFSSTDLNEKKKNDDENSQSTATTCEYDEKKNHDEKSISSTDINDEKNKNNKDTGDESTHNSKGYGHVSLEDLGVSVEYLKNIPWEAFDPTWEIRSVANDPWLGGYIQ